jgi:hypothetical protein
MPTTWLVTHNGHKITSKSQARVYRYLLAWSARGRTSREIEEASGWHHGKASGALSMLHRDGLVALLTWKRQGYGVYVLTEYVDGRPVRPRRHNVHAEPIEDE